MLATKSTSLSFTPLKHSRASVLQQTYNNKVKRPKILRSVYLCFVFIKISCWELYSQFHRIKPSMSRLILFYEQTLSSKWQFRSIRDVLNWDWH